MMSISGPLNFLVNLAFIALIVLLSSCGKNNVATQSLDHVGGQVIVGDVNWQDIEDITDQGILKNALAVAYLDLPAMDSRCTGFLIADDLIMTNQHCIPDSSYAIGVKAHFNYNKSVGKSSSLAFDCDEFVTNDERLDYAILRCKGSPGRTFGKIKLSSSTVAKSESVYVVHQNCDYYTTRSCDWYKKYSAGTVTDLADEIGHDADTLGGSSGSPLFSKVTHQLIGLHHVGTGNNGFGRGRMNYAVPVSEIVEFLKSDRPEIWSLLSGATRDPAVTEEPNNSFTTAYGVQFGETLRFSVSNSLDIDYFTFSVSSTKKSTIELAFSHAQGDLELKLYSSTGSLVFSSVGSSDVEKIQRTLKPGKYFVKVYGHKGASGAYRLSLK